MKYFEYILILVLFLSAAFSFFYFFRRLRIYHFYRLVWKAILKKKQYQSSEKYLPSFYLFKIVKELATSPKTTAKKALVYLCVGRTTTAQNYFEKRNLLYKLVLQAINKPREAIPFFEKAIKTTPDNMELLTELAALYFMNHNYQKGKMAVEKLNEKKLTSYCLAKKRYWQGYWDISDGDMLFASQNASQATKLFHKNKAYYEEAQAYLLLGTVYRVSVVADVAQVMFDTALNIFSAIKCQGEISWVYGNYGMLMSLQSRFEEADDYYLKAEEITKKMNRRQANAEIKNQRALLCLIQGKNEEATAFAQQALKKHLHLSNDDGVAFSKDLLANIFWNKKQFGNAMQFAFEAKNLYKQNGNLSAFAECSYLIALCLFEQDKNDDSEKILRELIEIIKKSPCNFHLANAYNLLGLIYLRKNDLRRAKGLFQQSLDLEQVNNRLGCIATDYANIGLIEFRRGDVEQAAKTLSTAIEYAEVNQEQELVDILKLRLEKLKG